MVSPLIVALFAESTIASLEREADCQSIVLEKKFGETRIADDSTPDIPNWHWPER
ncbi:MAG: hypothetical protein FWG81_06395 [Betaproteobacteria bacterium]|nr:hypothetical protein [Betaproteobacteria bacterium]